MNIQKNIQSIGIPRCLYYYYYPQLWETFFTELGLKVVLSRQTNQRIVETASQISEAEHCLPIKMFDGHLVDLKGQTDLIFVPRILSLLKKHWSCPKLSVLPDVAEIHAPGKILTVEVNEAKKDIYKILVELALGMGYAKNIAGKSAKKAMSAMQLAFKKRENTAKQKYLIIGHPYNIYDEFITNPILKKLDILQVPYELMAFDNSKIKKNFIKWDTSSKMYKKIMQLDKNEIQGVIQLSSFNCGCDSIMLEFYRNILKEKKIPYLILVLDEHSAQAGIDTRLEAFVDSVRWQNERNSGNS